MELGDNFTVDICLSMFDFELSCFLSNAFYIQRNFPDSKPAENTHDTEFESR